LTQLTTSFSVLLLLAAVFPAAAGQLPRPVLSVQETLIQLEREWNAAFQRNDVRTVERILADEFIAVYSDGSRGDKTKELELAASFNQQVDSTLLDDFTIRTYGDTAVVSFTLHMIGPRNGVPHQVSLRYVDLFVMREGRWQCVSSQSTRVSDAVK
jgi:ketosteroid isomerase-like protein